MHVDHLDLHVLTHSFPTRRSSDLKIVVELLRAGTDHLRGWREQLEAAGFVRTYPNAARGETLAQLWNDKRSSGHFEINVNLGNEADPGACVHATYQSDRKSTRLNSSH